VHRNIAARGGFASIVALAAMAGSQTAAAATINVSTGSQLQNAVASANSAGGNTTILLANGTYTLTDTLYINAPNVTIAGNAGARASVIIQGDGMSASASVGNLIRVARSGFQLHDVTLQRSRNHLIQIVGEENADSPVIKDCILRDAFEQMIKVSNDPSRPTQTGDGGLVENCVFDYTAGVAPQYYVGGIDAHASKNWIVRKNTFRNIISPNTSVAEFAVHFWDNSGNNTVEQNTIVNCDRGIGFGLMGKPNSGGTIRNNMIYHAANKGQFADVGISLQESPNTLVQNNTVILDNDITWAIEYRFAATQNVQIVNNLTNKSVRARDSAGASVSNNVASAVNSWFVAATSGDLHLASAVSAVVDKGQSVSGVSDDFDGQSRPQGSAFDVGADEYGGAASAKKPAPPTGVNAN
jgi:hypothetical protein